MLTRFLTTSVVVLHGHSLVGCGFAFTPPILAQQVPLLARL
nr:hypothetical protein [Mycobacteroides abscessus]